MTQNTQRAHFYKTIENICHQKGSKRKKRRNNKNLAHKSQGHKHFV